MVKQLIPPGGTRKHQFCTVERNGVEYWVDITDTRKKKATDSAYLYRLEGDQLVFDHYERVSLLRKEGVY